MAQEDFRFEAPPADPVPRTLIEGHEMSRWHRWKMPGRNGCLMMFNEHHRKIYG